jgi:ABC-type nitrate/sulfonate/bicarbonate transport system permease component
MSKAAPANTEVAARATARRDMSVPTGWRALSYDARVSWTRRAALLGIVVLWEVLARAFSDPRLVAPPSKVVVALFTQVLSDEKIRAACLLTFTEVSLAYLLSVVVGLGIGLAIGWSDLSRRGFFPVILLLYAVPQAILLPLFMLGFGIGPGMKIAFGFSHGVLPIIVNVVAGMRNVNRLYIRGSKSMGASTLDIARHVYFPHMVPSFFAGLRLAMTLTLLGVILAELYVSTEGIGYFTKRYAESFNTASLFALVLILAAIAVGLNEIVRIAERRFTRWMV